MMCDHDLGGGLSRSAIPHGAMIDSRRRCAIIFYYLYICYKTLVEVLVEVSHYLSYNNMLLLYYAGVLVPQRG